MTDTTLVPTIEDTTTTEPIAVGMVAFDLYRDIHKGIRTELFAVSADAGRLDPSDPTGRRALAAQVHGVIDLLVSHADHEDAHVQPAIERHLPDLAEVISGDHLRLEGRMDRLGEIADTLVHAAGHERRPLTHHLYLELSTFTGTYLLHQDVEERVVMPALEAAIGVPDAIRIHEAIIASIPPEEMAQSLAVMLPAMNVDDRAEMLGGMRAGAPPEVFAGVWSLAGSLLAPSDHAALARRLDIS